MPQLTEDALARRLASLARDTAGGLVVVARGERRAARLAELARGHAREGSAILLLPGWDCLPGDGSGPSAALAGRRALTLRELTEQAPDHALLIASAAAALQLLPRPSALAAGFHELATGDPFVPEDFRSALEVAGYVLDERVDEPGEAALRGEVVEIFPATAELPVRCEIADGRIRALRRYDPLSQRSVEEVQCAAVAPASELLLDEPAMEALVAAAVRHGADGEAVRTALGTRRGRGLAATFLPLVEGRATSLGELVAGRTWLIDDGAAERMQARRELAAEALEGSTAPTDGGPLATLYRLAQGKLLLAEATWQEGLARSRMVRLETATAEPDEPAAAPAAPLPAQLRLQPDELREGDHVVHLRHGRGRVVGLETLDPDGTPQDALVLDHAGDARVLVPVAELDEVWRYAGPAAELRLDAPGAARWQEQRASLEAEIRRDARLLVRHAQARARQAAPVIHADRRLEKFARRFGFEETPGQQQAIEAVLADLAAGRPMDRLVCGDVGYGKTEVALRAAAATAFAGLQVALLAPTTLLARQHLETFRRRFAGTGLRVEPMMRGLGRGEALATRAGLADGSVAIAIGTHALCGKGMAFARLGLVIVDEEQRFGTKQKAALDRLAAGHHHLAMTATPIPQTLQGALVGLRDLSVIDTPPQRRLPVRTILMPMDEGAIRTILRRERARGGQTFWVCPRIVDVEGAVDRAQEALPDGRILVAHGKLREAVLEETMLAFARGDGDVLVATSIIESGIDIPRANTMVVESPELLGLAQLHQLRGRVGRGARQAYLHLLAEDAEGPAAARLRALAATPSLGGGFALAALDLDQRGAGDLLGIEQSGHIDLLGPELHAHLLGRALRAARGERALPAKAEVALDLPAVIPDSYIPEPPLRLALHRRIARATDRAELLALTQEIRDRFGPLPEALGILLRMAAIAVDAGALGIAQLRAGPTGAALTFRTPQAAERARRRLAAQPTADDPRRVVVKGETVDAAARLDRIERLLERCRSRQRPAR